MASSSSSAQAARQHLADQLREIREDAGLTGRRLAELAGWHGVSKVSKIEHAARPITAEDLRTWCHICGVPAGRTQTLLAELRAAVGMWVSYQQLNRRGLKAAQESVRERYERVRLMRVYSNKVIPGLLQTEQYTTAALEAARREQGVEVDDVAGAVAERMDRRRVLHRADARFVFLLEESVLWYRTTSPRVHAEQLRHLISVMLMPSVTVAVIPRRADRTVTGWGVWPEESFTMTDFAQTNIELVSGYLTIVQPDEIAMYVSAWERLFPLAVVGESAAALVREAIEALPTG
ncbi:helix-turn-helix domain-containing protein [Nonomuraea endophytica]|uniref:Transcriptional regulator with XRE-family HTH domain n=1 Tax=Nonomuraea endophytica TaxID=714136 RepID=A0A7W8EI45_9ACTN|nr:helix-turn-helix transcriptional regulator [Nonomuraea endophytica]MBB5080274.1 transcriptional regulator with XRE-family HTH domain [Nonomuraea endophytica]